MTPGEPVLRLHDVDKEFNEPQGILRILRKLRLTVRRGEIVMITGPSGSGKTTMLQIAGCLIRPTSGCVEVGGLDMSDADESERLEARRRHLGFVFQSFHLLAALPVVENVALGLRLRRQPIDQGRVHEIIETLGIGTKARKYPRHLSGGERQRVAIARALVGRPDLILADEPTSQLDSNSAATVGRLLQQAAHEFNTAVVVTTHDPRLGSIADRKVALEAGVLHE
jgi:putative ABC transport system ATP-binding protein